MNRFLRTEIGLSVFFFLLFPFFLLAGTTESAPLRDVLPEKREEGPVVYFADLEGVIGVPLEEHLGNVFHAIGEEKNRLLVLRIDTPGGLVDSMSAIVTRIAAADFPVVLWVAPSGARAASAGAFIVQASHVAAMAPGTNMGAAHSVTGRGKDIDNKEINRKITNDLTAKMRSFAQERGRNVKAAESMVTKSASFSARDALKKGLIDFVASDERELLAKLDGRKLDVKGKPVVLSLKDYRIERISMTARLKALEIFSRPDIAYLALIAGIFLIILEAKAPGGFVMGIAGAISLILAFYGLRVLPVNFAGVALLVGGIVVIVLDLVFGGIGILAVTGIGAMLFGGLILFRAPGGELLHLSYGFMAGVTLVVAVVFLFVLRLVYKALRKKALSDGEEMIGERVTISGGTEKNLMVLIHGEYWRVLPVDPYTELAIGDEVEIVKVVSLTLYVKLVKSPGFPG